MESWDSPQCKARPAGRVTIAGRAIHFRALLAGLLGGSLPAAAAPPPAGLWKATLASYETADGPAAAAVDGDFSAENGWNVQGGENNEQAAVFILKTPQDAIEWQVQLSCFATEPDSYPVCFEVAVTRDPTPDLESEWTPLLPGEALALRGGDHLNLSTVQRTSVALGRLGPAPIIAMRALAPFPGVTGFRLNLVPAPATSQASSLTANPHGICVVTEFEIAANPTRSTNVAAGRPVIASGPLEDGLPSSYLTDGFTGSFSRPKAAFGTADFHFDIDLGRRLPIHHLILRSRRPDAPFAPVTVALGDNREVPFPYSARVESTAASASRLSIPEAVDTRWVRVTVADPPAAAGSFSDLAEVEVYPLLQLNVIRWFADGHLLDHKDAPAASRHLHFDLSATPAIPLEAIRAIQYRIPGWQENWQTVEPSRGIDIVAPPAADYALQLQALHSDGVWDSSGRDFSFTVLPVWWRAPGFVGPAAALLLSTIGLIWRQFAILRLGRRLAETRHENAMQRERLRIARDMHDDIGARLTQLAFLAEEMEHSPPGETVSTARIAAEARETIASLDQIVWAINPRNDTVGGFSEYLSRHASRYLSSAGVRLREEIVIARPEREMGFETRHNLLMACNEAIQNIVKHSGARDAWLAISDPETTLRISIRDNGHGFSAPPGDPDHSGLDNMRERLAESGGSCEWSSSDQGTTICMTLSLTPSAT